MNIGRGVYREEKKIIVREKEIEREGICE